MSADKHAWNQVEIDDEQWIEVDPTWDCNNGLKYIGTDKEKFWESHGRLKSLYSVVESDEHEVSNFDLNGFICSELHLPKNHIFSLKEQKELLELMKQRDFKGKDISLKCSKILQKSKKTRREPKIYRQNKQYEKPDNKEQNVCYEKADNKE